MFVQRKMVILTIIINTILLMCSIAVIKKLLANELIVSVLGQSQEISLILVILTILSITLILPAIGLTTRSPGIGILIKIPVNAAALWVLYKLYMLKRTLEKGYDWCVDSIDLVIRKLYTLHEKQSWLTELREYVPISDDSWKTMIQSINYDGITSFKDAKLLLQNYLLEMKTPLIHDYVNTLPQIANLTQPHPIPKAIKTLIDDVAYPISKTIFDLLSNPHFWGVATTCIAVYGSYRLYHYGLGAIDDFFQSGSRFGSVLGNAISEIGNSFAKAGTFGNNIADMARISNDCDAVFSASIALLRDENAIVHARIDALTITIAQLQASLEKLCLQQPLLQEQAKILTESLNVLTAIFT